MLRIKRTYDPPARGDGLLLHSARPEALHQDPPAVSAHGRFIRSLDPEHGRLSPWRRRHPRVLFNAAPLCMAT